ncbi:hypothetical protein PC128_g12332 [Phytophthora cactorum]|nr:hypothetical protein PC128_g12332 [Phytophthora cactorum]
MCTTWVVPSRYITSATRLTLARYNESGIMNNDEMDAALMVFVNCLGAKTKMKQLWLLAGKKMQGHMLVKLEIPR